MRRVSCLLLVLAASCASSPKVPLRTQQELWLQSEREAIRNAWRPSPRTRVRVADGAIERLDELLSENFESTKGAWCVVLLGEWFLVRSEIYGDDDERKVADDAIEELDDLLQEQRSDTGLDGAWLMVLLGEWYLVRATATGDDSDRKVAVDYFENVVAQVDTETWPEGAAAAKDGLKRAQAAPSPETQGILEDP